MYLSEISEKGLNCIGHLFNERQKLKTWDELEQEYTFHEYKNFYLCSYYIQFINQGKTIFLVIHNLVLQDHHLIRKTSHVFSK